jgi:septin family protein
MDLSSGQLSSDSYDHSFKILLIGEAGVGKTSLIASFVSTPLNLLRPPFVLSFLLLLLFKPTFSFVMLITNISNVLMWLFFFHYFLAAKQSNNVRSMTLTSKLHIYLIYILINVI